jgi:oxygen-dependent protoporphyrinogen oxidase
MRVVIVGAGISGLSIACELLEAGLDRNDLLLLEAAPRAGGNIATSRENGLTIEHGPNGFLDNAPATLHLVERTGLGSALLTSNRSAARRFIYRGKRLRCIETSPLKFLTEGVLPLSAALRVAMEPMVKKGGCPTESVYDFAARRIGRGAADILVDAMVSGVFAGNSRELELASAFPKMVAMESRYGSLVKAMIARKRMGAGGGGPAGPAGVLTSFVDGMQTLPDALAALQKDRLITDCPVQSVQHTSGGWMVSAANRPPVEADAVVLACPAYAASQILSGLDPSMQNELGDIAYPPVTVVATAFDNLPEKPDGFGFLVPRGQGLHILGSLWTSSIWQHRTPEGTTLLRTMVGGAHDPGSAELDDTAVLGLVLRDLKAAMGVTGDPTGVRIFRYDRAIAQYRPGHRARMQQLRRRLDRYPGLFLAGSAYDGISVNHCVEEATRVAAQVMASLIS